MPTAALYDIHGNLPALEAVLQEISHAPIDQLVIGGDVIVGPMSPQCLDLLSQMDMPIHFILGNCEVAVLALMAHQDPGPFPPNVLEEIQWTADQMLPPHETLMRQWPKTLSLSITGLGKVLFCHATPRNETEIFTRLTSDEKLLPIFDQVGVDYVICGHTHMQFDRMIGDVRVINAGSVGMPFGVAGADWLVLGPRIELRHTAYELQEAGDRILATDYPRVADFVAQYVLNPPSEEVMLEVLRKRELGGG